MIGYLKGKIHLIRNNFIILDVNGVGYKIFVTSEMIVNSQEGIERELFIHNYIREDALSLFGFDSFAGLEMFELLLSVSGVGPKSALSILSEAEVEKIQQVIAKEDPTLFTKISGIGLKTAQRIILELKGKITLESVDTEEISDSQDIVDALSKLGYRTHEIKKYVRLIPKELKTTSEKIKWMLKELGK